MVKSHYSSGGDLLMLITALAYPVEGHVGKRGKSYGEQWGPPVLTLPVEETPREQSLIM